VKRARIGGQAVIEGVMMKHGDQYAVAVRKPDNDIEVKLEEYKPIGDKYKILKLPILRGIVNFVESLVIGMKTLTYSAEFYEDEEENDKTQGDKADNIKTAKDKKTEKNNDEGSSKSDDLMMVGTVIVSIVLAIAIFMLLPAFIAELIGKVVHNHILLSIIEGIIRLAVFIGYVLAISLMKDIQRVFMYHGAEHKSINCFEAGDELTPENIKKHSRYHKRCGTSFLFVVMFISIVAFMFIRVKTLWLKMVMRVLLVPLIAGVSYEFIMYAGKSDSALANALSKPGMWIQRLTTREPDLDMIEVAIKSVEAVIDWREYQRAMKNGEIED
jgi:uncharacterized protein YqhQ